MVFREENKQRGVGCFESMVERIMLCERPSDRRFLETAYKAFSIILEFFQTLSFGDSLEVFGVPHPEGIEHGIAFDLTRIRGMGDAFPGTIYFFPATGRVAGGFTKDNLNEFKMTFPIRLPPKVFGERAPTDIPHWFSKLRNTFVHEFSHYLDSQRNPVMFKGRRIDGQKLNKSDPKLIKALLRDYYNSPTEMQAYYIQTIEEPFRNFDAIIDETKAAGTRKAVANLLRQSLMVLRRNPREFSKSFERAAKVIGYWPHLTDSNKRRFLKRATTTYYDFKKRLDKILPPRWAEMSSAMVDRFEKGTL